MSGLPRAIIKKYGVSKKAWAVFRGRKGKRKRSSSPKRRTKRRVYSMARYRKRRGRSRGGRKFLGLGTKGLVSLGILGAGAGALFGETIGNMIPVVNQQSSLIKGAAGAFIIGGPAGAALNIAKQFFTGGSFGGSTGGAW